MGVPCASVSFHSIGFPAKYIPDLWAISACTAFCGRWYRLPSLRNTVPVSIKQKVTFAHTHSARSSLTQSKSHGLAPS